MGSFFINAGLLAGVTLAAIPVILHLLMKQKPKHIVFPALRLLKARQRQSRRRLRIKNWLLLLARMALIALMALALARPRLWSRSTQTDAQVPTSIAFVFDTSPSMSYVERDKSRLVEAKERAIKTLERVHEASRVFVIDSADPLTHVGLSPTAARKRVNELGIQLVGRPLNEAVKEARKAIASVDLPRREVYIFTDLCRSSWNPDQPIDEGSKAEKDKESDSATYVVRLAPDTWRNAGIVEADTAGAFNIAGDSILVEALVRSTGPGSERLVEFVVDGTKRAQQTVGLPENGQARVQFVSPRLSEGIHRCEFRLAGEPDPFTEDDRRYLTLDVQAPLKVLLISDLSLDAEFVAEALDPVSLRQAGPRPFPVDLMTTARLDSALKTPLREYAAVFLLNVRSLPQTFWSNLNRYVRDGGGLVLAMGSRVDAASWNTEAATLLPGTLGAVQEVPARDLTFGKAEIDHSFFNRNTRELLAELSRVPISRYMTVAPNPGARVLLSYQNGSPSLLERSFPGLKTGHVLLWTTTLSRRPGNTPEEIRESWTDFPLPTTGWSFFYLMNQTVPFLAGVVGKRLNFEAGESVLLANDPALMGYSYTIQGPGTQPAKLNQGPTGAGLLIPAPPVLGQWTLTATQAGKPARNLGFSVNLPAGEAQFSSLTQEELAALFGGPDRFALADDPKSVEKVVQNYRFGRELFPWIMALILLIVTLENTVANTFYREQPASAGGAEGGAASQAAPAA